MAKVYVKGRICRYSGEYDTGNPRPVDSEYAWDIPEDALKDGYQVMEVVAMSPGLAVDWVEILIDV